MNRWLKYMIVLALLGSGGALFYNKVYIPKSTFKTIKPTLGDLNVSVRGIGNVGAKNIYSITAQSGGKIEKVFFDEGDWVKKGDLLLTIDAVDLPQAQDEAKMAHNKSKYEIEVLKSNLESLNAQKKLIEVTHSRYKKLLEGGFASQAEYDKSKSELDAIEAQIKASNAQIASATSEMMKQQKSIEALGTKLNRLSVYAPVDGYISKKEAEVAQYVLPSTTIFKIVDPKTLWIETNIDERVSNKVKLAQNASIKLRSQQNKLYEGSVERIGATSNAVTLEREVAVAFKEIPKPFYINEQAEVNINVASYSNVLKIPAKYISMQEGKKGVWVYEDDMAKFKEISIKAQGEGEVAIESGLDTNSELLVLDSTKKPLSVGMKIYK